MTGISVSNGELVTSRDFRGRMAHHLDSLRGRNRRDKIVLTRNGEMEAVVLSVERYAELTKEDA